MAKLTATQVTGLRKIQGDRSHEVHGRTLASLRNRFLIKGMDDSPVLTASGQSALAEHYQAEHMAKVKAEKASRPVPASAFVEPSASRPVASFPEYDDAAEAAEAQDESAEATPEPSREDALSMIGQVHAGNAGDAVWKPFNAGDYRTALEVATRKVAEQSAEELNTRSGVVDLGTGELSAPAVPQAWVDQLVILLDADARIVLEGGRWTGCGTIPFRMDTDRLDAAATEAIRLEIVEALPPTLNGTVRLAFAPGFRLHT